MRIAVTTTKLHQDALAMLRASGAELRILPQEETAEATEAALRAFDPHGLISRSVRLTGAAIEAAASLRVIAKTGVGVDNIDLEAATRRGIPVLSNTGANARSVAEHALGLMLALARNTHRHDAAMRAGRWSRSDFPAFELRGRHLGLVGFGHSAQHLAAMATALGMTVSTYAPRFRHGAPTLPVEGATSFADLLRRADIVSLHCPLTDQTRGMMDKAAFATMPRGGWLVNVSRGAVVDEAALLDALGSGQLGRAALDVHASEPMPQTHPLFAMDTVVLTPHVAGATRESMARAHVAAASNLLAMLEGRVPKGATVVNPTYTEAALER